MSNIQFCHNSSFFYQDLLELISKQIINLSHDDINNKYRYWYDNFNSEKSLDFAVKKNFLPIEFELPLDACYLGIDFPSWINFEATKKRIMLIGIDPLRNESAFSSHNIFNDVLIGTPYAFHHKSMREGRTKEYWNFISLISNSYSLYITDIYKIFYYREKYKGIRSYNAFSSKGITAQEDILEAEISLIKPDVIIALGNKTVKLLTNQKNLIPTLVNINVAESKMFYKRNTPLIPMVHLSGGSYDSHKQTFLKSNNKYGKNYGELYFEIVSDYLAQL